MISVIAGVNVGAIGKGMGSEAKVLLGLYCSQGEILIHNTEDNSHNNTTVGWLEGSSVDVLFSVNAGNESDVLFDGGSRVSEFTVADGSILLNILICKERILFYIHIRQRANINNVILGFQMTQLRERKHWGSLSK